VCLCGVGREGPLSDTTRQERVPHENTSSELLFISWSSGLLIGGVDRWEVTTKTRSLRRISRSDDMLGIAGTYRYIFCVCIPTSRQRREWQKGV
jgi:hypothetical protein